MNTREIDDLSDWDEKTLTMLIGRYVRVFHRFPSYDELVRLQRARGGLQLRLPPRQTRRRVGILTPQT
ncbi:MAG: hypothetical protein HOQ22_18085 [Nocardioidaceae bacterium]|nr:hypothetical protein [Nocardioidaceae bacterium]NUS52937.1 hypothetical protein [Nocardioidaceae bacterium]